MAVVCQCVVAYASGQITIGRVITDRQLVWEDFKGAADEGSPFSAMTHWTVGYRAHVDSARSDTMFLSFRVTPVFSNYASWVKKEKIKKKKEAERLLQHEQGHYDIAILCAETLRQNLQSAVFMRNSYSAKADSIADATVKFFTQIEDEYDLQTAHSQNKEEQERWNRNIASLFIKIPERFPR